MQLGRETQIRNKTAQITILVDSGYPCIHLAPINIGRIAVEIESLGKLQNIFAGILRDIFNQNMSHMK